MSDDKLMKREEKAPATVARRHRKISPACDVYENADEFLITAEMPGIESDSIDIQLDRYRLTIQAMRPAEEGSADDSMAYTRAFEIPETVDPGKIDAKMHNGVLSVHLPKAPQARVRQITVTAG